MNCQGGSVRITANLEQYERIDTTVSIKQDNQRIHIRMKANFGFLEIKPAYSDGIGKDEQWSLTLNGQSFYSLENKLPADKYKGELSHKCYEDISFNIAVNKGKRQVFDMAKQVKLKKGGLVLKAEKNGEPVFVNGKQVGKTPFSGSVPLCAVIEVGKGKEKVDVVLEHNGRVEYTHEYAYKVLFNRGVEYGNKGNYDQAIEDFNEALRIKPDDKVALYYRAGAYRFKGNYDRAIEDYNAALRIEPDYQDALRARGLAYVGKGNYDRAIEDYTAALRIKPDLLALLFRGVAYYNKGNYDRAIEDYTAALRIKPDHQYALYWRGLAYVGKGNYDRAIEDYNAALRIKPDYLEALSYRGFAYAKKGNDDRAIEDYNAALRIKPDYLDALYHRGLAYYAKGNYDRAIEDFNAALRIKPDHYNALYDRGGMYYNKGNYDRAIEDFNAALRIKPDHQYALYWRGMAYVGKGNYDRAIEDFEATLKIDPNNTLARNSLEKIHQIKARAKSNSYANESYPPPATQANTPNYANVSYGSILTDSRDGKKYKTVVIGRQIWMAENLNYNASGSKCHDNLESNCDIYGRLYNWNTAKKACPKGWFLPNNAEWEGLKSSVHVGNVGSSGYWWSHTDTERSYSAYVLRYVDWSLSYDGKSSLHSVRCLRRP